MSIFPRAAAVVGMAVFLLPAGAWAQAPSIEIDEQRAEPSKWTTDINNTYQAYLPFEEDQQDFLDAQRGRLAKLDPLVIESEHCLGTPDSELCTTIWDMSAYEFLNPHVAESDIPETPYTAKDFTEAPGSANPSLWRNAILNTLHGVFEVVPGEIYQVRGYDLSNMSAIRGKTGWIIIDPLTTKETAQAALDNLNRAYMVHAGKDPLPVSAIIFTHSHVDHFGGVGGLEGGLMGVLPGAKIYAPAGFVEEAVSENVIVGNAMGRRATYMYGPLLKRGPKGQIDGGLGKSTPAGTTGLREPDCVIGTGSFGGDCGDDWGSNTEFPEILDGVIDGVRVQFQNVPGSEAPAEMLFYFPDLKALCASEDVTHTFHNVLTLRGANVRDSLLWAKYLHETLEYFAEADVIFASHHWPTWNFQEDGETLVDTNVPDRVEEIIELQRDLYRYIHDQSVRLTNKGYTMQEVGEMVKLPPALGRRWFNRSYYGTVNHNAKAVYQRYIGWFDANPASLHQLPPTEAAPEYVRYMGGVESILELAREDYENGNYRWVAMVLNHVIFSGTVEPVGAGKRIGAGKKARSTKNEARMLLADTYDQLAYQSESGPWRNFYLTGAMELRNGVLPLPAVKTFTRETVEAMTLDMIFDFVAVHVDGLAAGSMDHELAVEFWSLDGEPREGDGAMEASSTLHLENGVLNYDIGDLPVEPETTMHLTRSLLDDIVMGEDADGNPIDQASLVCADGVEIGTTEAENCIVVEGERAAVDDLFSVMDSFEFWFEIVGPGEPLGTPQIPQI